MTIRVLLADDHALMREGLHALLSADPGISVIGGVHSGREAVRETERLNPDIVVMDIAMPDMNGIEAVWLIHAKRPATRVIMLSMHATSEHVYRAFDAGASGYLLKEAAGEEVIAALRTVHAGRRYLSSGLADFMADPDAFRHARSPVESLSPRERQVLQLVVEGKTSNEIAGMVHLSVKSVETYRGRLMKKLGVTDVPALVKFALEHGLTPPA